MLSGAGNHLGYRFWKSNLNSDRYEFRIKMRMKIGYNYLSTCGGSRAMVIQKIMLHIAGRYLDRLLICSASPFIDASVLHSRLGYLPTLNTPESVVE